MLCGCSGKEGNPLFCREKGRKEECAERKKKIRK
jgi:hypothetical protein